MKIITQFNLIYLKQVNVIDDELCSYTTRTVQYSSYSQALPKNNSLLR